MAAKRSIEEKREANLRAKNERRYEAICKKLPPLSFAAAAVALAALLSFFCSWAYIYNTDIAGSEVSVSGWSFALSAVTKNYSSPGALYGDLAVPFYYYAAEYCETLSALTLTAAAAVVICLAVQAIFAAIKLHAASVACAVLDIVSAVLLFVCQSTALSMSGSQILPVYCSGNPACSICSLAAIPAMVMLLAAVLNVIVFVIYIRAKKLLK